MRIFHNVTHFCLDTIAIPRLNLNFWHILPVVRDMQFHSLESTHTLGAAFAWIPTKIYGIPKARAHAREPVKRFGILFKLRAQATQSASMYAPNVTWHLFYARSPISKSYPSCNKMGKIKFRDYVGDLNKWEETVCLLAHNKLYTLSTI